MQRRKHSLIANAADDYIKTTRLHDLRFSISSHVSHAEIQHVSFMKKLPARPALQTMQDIIFKRQFPQMLQVFCWSEFRYTVH